MTYTLLAAILLLLSSGDLAWANGWLYVLALAAGQLATAWTLALADEGLLEERSAAMAGEDIKAWDGWLAPLTTFAPLAIALVAGLAERWRWTPAFAPAVPLGGLGIFAAALLLGLWAMSANPFFTPVVRIRPGHGHTVATGGPYQFLRHPGSLSTIVADLAIPLILGSPWAYAAAVVAVGFVVLRMALEDRALRAELPGYGDYAGGVRWALIPGGVVGAHRGRSRR